MYCVNGLKYNPLSVSQIFYNGNKIKFISKCYAVKRLKTCEVSLKAQKSKNLYKMT